MRIRTLLHTYQLISNALPATAPPGFTRYTRQQCKQRRAAHRQSPIGGGPGGRQPPESRPARTHRYCSAPPSPPLPARQELSLLPRQHQLRQRLQRVAADGGMLRLRGRQRINRCRREVRLPRRRSKRLLDALAVVHVVHRLLHVPRALVRAQDHGEQLRELMRRVEHRRGRQAALEVIQRGFAERGGRRGEVEHVIRDLEGHPQVAAVGLRQVAHARLAPREHRDAARAVGRQRRRLVERLEVVLLLRLVEVKAAAAAASGRPQLYDLP
mmetsp:Transcript_14723/g.37391  ORF Transcript_14723/g.37391 Transcript_14723/m.37391 type:complete len:270 (+) Transcript_14723:46-855(+)